MLHWAPSYDICRSAMNINMLLLFDFVGRTDLCVAVICIDDAEECGWRLDVVTHTKKRIVLNTAERTDNTRSLCWAVLCLFMFLCVWLWRILHLCFKCTCVWVWYIWKDATQFGMNFRLHCALWPGICPPCIISALGKDGSEFKSNKCN